MPLKKIDGKVHLVPAKRRGFKLFGQKPPQVIRPCPEADMIKLQTALIKHVEPAFWKREIV